MFNKIHHEMVKTLDIVGLFDAGAGAIVLNGQKEDQRVSSSY